MTDSHLVWFIEKILCSIFEPAYQTKWITEYVQAKNKNIHLFDGLQQTQMTDNIPIPREGVRDVSTTGIQAAHLTGVMFGDHVCQLLLVINFIGDLEIC